MNKTIYDNANITASSKQLEVLQKHFPQCFDKHEAFMPEKLQDLVSASGSEVSKESYALNWLGKSYARLLANENPRTLLSEDKEHNAKPENKASENLLIKGDNLEVLKHLVHAYSEQVKMIYIDPPYNTGSDGFVYQDDRKFTPKQLSQLAGIDQDEAKRILDFTQRKANSHSAWLTFMYPRLYVARELLKDDGVIFISIDDNEVAQLKMLCDEVFGEQNFRGNIVRATGTTTGQEALKLGGSYDVCLCYAKSAQFELKGIPLKGKDLNRFNNDDNDGKGKYALLQLRKTGNADRKEDREGMFFPIEAIDGSLVFPIGPTNYLSRWRVGKKKFQTFLDEGLIVWKQNGDDIEEFDDYEEGNGDDISDYSEITNENVDISKYKSKWKPYVKYYLSDRTKQVSDLWIDIDGNKKGSIELKEIFDNKKLFENPKPTGFINRMLIISCNNNDLIFDFFAGSGTTAHAVMQLNAEDGGNRRCISVQIDEATDKKSEAYKADYKSIFDITKARIEKAAAKIKEENPDYKGDLGFKIFETKPLSEDYLQDISTLSIEQQVLPMMSNNVDDMLTTWKVYDGIALTQSLEEVDLAGYTAYQYDKVCYLMHTGFISAALVVFLQNLDDTSNAFEIEKLVVNGVNFGSKYQREIYEAITQYKNKKDKHINVEFRY